MNRPAARIASVSVATLLAWAAMATAEGKPGGMGDRQPASPSRKAPPIDPPVSPIPQPPGAPLAPPGVAPPAAPSAPPLPPPTVPPVPLLPMPAAPLGAAPVRPLGGAGPMAGVMGTLHVQVNNPADVVALALALGLAVRHASPDGRVLSLAAPPGADLTLLLQRLRGDPRVKSADLEALEFVRPAR